MWAVFESTNKGVNLVLKRHHMNLATKFGVTRCYSHLACKVHRSTPLEVYPEGVLFELSNMSDPGKDHYDLLPRSYTHLEA